MQEQIPSIISHHSGFKMCQMLRLPLPMQREVVIPQTTIIRVQRQVVDYFRLT
jgi:hypothetical protein